MIGSKCRCLYSSRNPERPISSRSLSALLAVVPRSSPSVSAGRKRRRRMGKTRAPSTGCGSVRIPSRSVAVVGTVLTLLIPPSSFKTYWRWTTPFARFSFVFSSS
uniref:Uncharacterized protein n=1 Tax=uncultured marine virus TaxID=186617 RepID=A0A0F7LB03_9VIRU|nr:hypothetical protein [uncultured marine virus]